MTSSGPLLAEFRFLTCRLCNEPVYRPRILHCWHFFCLHCIGGLLTSNDSVNCPLCGAQTLLRNEGLGGLTHKASGLLSRLSETWETISVCDLDTVVRHYCHRLAKTNPNPVECRIPSTRVCKSCNEYLCEDCSPLHLTEMHSEKYDVCTRHNEPELAFCEDCRVMACFMCTREAHMYHDTWGLVEKAEEYKVEVRELIQKCRNGKWRVEDDLEENVKKAKSEIQNEAKQTLEFLTEAIKERESELIGQVDKFALEMWIKIQKLKKNSKFKPQTEKYDGLITLGEGLMDFGSSHEIVTTHQHLRYRLEGAIADQSPMQLLPENLRKKVFLVPAELRAIEEERLIGNLSFSTKDSKQAFSDSPSPKKGRKKDVIPKWLTGDDSDSEGEAGAPSTGGRRPSLKEKIRRIGRDLKRGRSMESILDDDDDENSKGNDVPPSPSFKEKHDAVGQAQSGKNQRGRRKLSLPAASFHISMESLIPGKHAHLKDKDQTASPGKLRNARERRFSVFSTNRFSRKEAPIVEDAREDKEKESAGQKKHNSPKLFKALRDTPSPSPKAKHNSPMALRDAEGQAQSGKNQRKQRKLSLPAASLHISMESLLTGKHVQEDKEQTASPGKLRYTKERRFSVFSAFSRKEAPIAEDAGEDQEKESSMQKKILGPEPSSSSIGSSVSVPDTGSETEEEHENEEEEAKEEETEEEEKREEEREEEEGGEEGMEEEERHEEENEESEREEEEEKEEEKEREEEKDEKEYSKKPRFKVKNLMKKAKSTLSLFPTRNNEPKDKDTKAWGDMSVRRKQNGAFTPNGSMSFRDVEFEDLSDTTDFDYSRKRYSLASTASSTTVTSTGSEGDRTVTRTDTSGEGASSSSAETRKRRDPKRWMSKRKKDIRVLGKRIGSDVANTFKSWAGKDEPIEEPEDDRRPHPWDEIPAGSARNRDWNLSETADDGNDNYDGGERNRRVTFQSESDNSDAETRHSDTDDSPRNIEESDADPKVSDDERSDDLDRNAANGYEPHIPKTRATKYEPRKWSRLKANLTPHRTVGETKSFDPDRGAKGTEPAPKFNRARRSSMF